jgi:plasmid stabilization system protein ParE
MPNLVGDIAIQVGADIAPLVRDLGRAQGSVNRFGATATQTSGRMRAFTLAGAAMAATVVAAGTAVAALTKRNLDNIDSMSKQARAVGLAVNQYQAMALVANEAGVETDKLSKLIVKMQDSIGNLAQGTTTQVDAFQRLGLSMSDIGGLGADEQFRIIAERIAAIGDPATRTSTALDIFGKSGAEALTMFQGYGAAVEEAAAFQREFGLAVSDFDAQQIEAANDAMGRLGAAAGGLGTLLAVELAPAIIFVSESITAMIGRFAEARRLAEENTPEQRAFANALTDVGNAAGALVPELNQAIGILEAWGNAATAAEIRSIVDEMNALADAARNGTIQADELDRKMRELIDRAGAAFSALSDIDKAQFGGVIAGVNALASRLGVAVNMAKQLRASLPGGVSDPSQLETGPLDTVLSDPFSNNPDAPRTRPISAPNDIDFGLPGSGGGGGGGGGGDALAVRLEQMRESFQSESEELAAQHEERLAQLEDFRNAKLLTEEEYNELEAQAKEQHEERLKGIEDAARSARLSAVAGAFGDLASLMQSSNDKLFKIGQAAAIAEATVSGYQAAVDAWQKGMKIGGPPVAAAFTAASLAKTGSLIAGIASQSARGGSRGGAAGGGSAQPAGGQQATAPLDVRLSGIGAGDLFSGAQIGGLLDRLADEAGDRGYRIMVAA